jgi:D-alanyl-D-alanine carboxypeptidase
VIGRFAQGARFGLLSCYLFVVALLAPVAGWTAPYAAFVMDARTGEVIHSRNADTRLHPASLTKMMTLYVAFQALQRGEITLDTEVTVTALAAQQPPSRLGLQEGQVIRLRYLLRAAAIRSANDAATAIGVAIAGSEAAYAERMNATAAAMGMTNTHFINMHGLTADGHYSTAHDMSILGRHLIYDFPQYYNLFSRRTADAGIAEVTNTNRRFLDNYPGADGIKTGYTVAAGYNLVASAERNGVRIIATVFGGTSTANRNARITELLDMGFAAADPNARVQPPDAPAASTYVATADPTVVQGSSEPVTGGVARTVRVTGQVQTAIRPVARGTPMGTPSGGDPAIEDALALALAESVAESLAAGPEEAALADATQAAAAGTVGVDDVTNIAEVAALAATAAEPGALPEVVLDSPLIETAFEAAPEVTPQARPAEIIMTAEAIAPAPSATPEATEVVEAFSTAGGGGWGINIGNFGTRDQAERALIQVAMAEAAVVEGGVRNITQRQGGFDGNIVGLSREAADLACRRLQARQITCFMLGSEG